MRTLFRVVLTLLIALPILLVLAVFWVLHGRPPELKTPESDSTPESGSDRRTSTG